MPHILEIDFENAHAEIPPWLLATDSRPVDEEPSVERIERLPPKTRIVSDTDKLIREVSRYLTSTEEYYSFNPIFRRDWQQPVLRAANDNDYGDVLEEWCSTRVAAKRGPLVLERWRPKDLPASANDNVRFPEEYRAIFDAWSEAHPETDSEILPRAPRNVSARYTDEELKALRWWLDLTRPREPLQSDFERVASALHGKRERKFDLETPEALVKLCEDGVDFDTRMVRVLRDGVPQTRALKVPRDGDNVERQAIKQDNVESILKNSGKVIKAGTGSQLLRALQFARNVPKVKPDTIGKMRESWPDITMDEALERKRTQKAANILAFVTHGMKLPVSGVGLLRFADNEERTKNGRRCRLGTLIERGKRGKDGKIYWYELRDEFSDPRGYGTVSTTWDEEETRKRGWKKSPNQAGVLSGALSFGNNHNHGATLQPANNGSMANNGITALEDDSLDDQPQTHHGRDKLQDSPEDLLEHKETMGEARALLSTQDRRVLDMLRGDFGEVIAANDTDVGRALAGNRRLSDKSLERRGRRAVDDTIEELLKIYQKLAA
jgi:hypothetical protein